MLPLQLAPIEDKFRSYIKEVKSRHIMPVFFYIAASQPVAEPVVNCLMTVKDVKQIENVDDHVLTDWFI